MTTNQTYRFRFSGSEEIFPVAASCERDGAARLLSIASGRYIPADTLSVRDLTYSTRRRVICSSSIILFSTPMGSAVRS